MTENDGTRMSTGRKNVDTDSTTRWARRSPGWPWWLALLLVPLLLAALVAGVAHGSIQDSLTGKAKAALAAKGLDGVGVSFSGRDGTLRVPSGVDAAAAKKAVAGVDGVRVAKVAGGSGADSTAGKDSGKDPGEDAGSQVEAASPYSLSSDGKAVTVTATVPDDTAKKALLDEVKGAVGPATVVDKVTVQADAVAPAAEALGGLAAPMAKAAGTKADWDGSTLTISGPANAAASKAIAAAAGTAAGGSVDNQLKTTGGNGTDAGAACAKLDASLAALQKQQRIEFAESSADLTAASGKTLDAVAGLLKKCGSAKVEVGGYTDNQGSQASSLPLSQRRAEAVRAALVDRGVPGTRVTAKGYGESNPVASNDTADGRAANRRVEITVQ